MLILLVLAHLSKADWQRHAVTPCLHRQEQRRSKAACSEVSTGQITLWPEYSCHKSCTVYCRWFAQWINWYTNEKFLGTKHVLANRAGLVQLHFFFSCGLYNKTVAPLPFHLLVLSFLFPFPNSLVLCPRSKEITFLNNKNWKMQEDQFIKSEELLLMHYVIPFLTRILPCN